MKPIYLTLISILLTLTSFSQTLQNGGQAQPQFKFWLAFEDSIGQRDTIWVMSFDVTEQNFLDSVETSFMADTADSVFTVYKQRQGNIQGITKVGAYGINLKSISFDIQAQNYHLPLTIRWDSSLLRNNGLPWDINGANLDNNYIWIYFLDNTLDMFLQDSVILPEFEIGGGSGSHFPLAFGISETFVGPFVKENLYNKYAKLYPIPANDEVIVQSNKKHKEIKLYNAFGEELLLTKRFRLNVSSYSNGIYFIKINYYDNTSEIHSIIIQH